MQIISNLNVWLTCPSPNPETDKNDPEEIKELNILTEEKEKEREPSGTKEQ